ncbi:histidine phosphatase family protein [Asticcacaulis sp. YBE204]|uniref:SixA phosphatase family protein n=1 Tax=Asticcacaulis sp. YBE204 TaxID=1282363 RepID=UPI0003C3F16C|nr:histidine phosphatase family protein [Asticcacaulis sp. YBE204]ESQ80146.1 phosphohistidine phosphatase [Asticcacaulis sp. YBE204]
MMKHLIVMRHGKAEKDAESGEDFERDLMQRGVREATAVAEALKARGLKPDFALVSSAHRTSQTFDAVNAVLGPIHAERRDDLYNAGANDLRRLVEAHEEAGDCLLVIGHNPGIQYLILDYMTEGAASQTEIDKVRGTYPTAAATVFEVDVAGRPLYDGVLKPKDLGE